jgi:hypothetical protein
LQNELEGVNDEKVGFYGRCVLHGIGPECQSAYDPTDAMDSRKEKEFTCARTEVFPLLWHYQKWIGRLTYDIKYLLDYYRVTRAVDGIVSIIIIAVP